MSKPYIHYIGHLVALSHAIHHSEESPNFIERMWNSPYPEEDVSHKIDTLIDGAIGAMRKVTDNEREDRIFDHEVHVAANGVEMWMQSIEITLQEYYEDLQLANIMGKRIHAPNHTLTVVTQAVRLIDLVKTSPHLIAQLGGRQTARDSINRGWTLLSRLYQALKPITSHALCRENYQGILEFFSTLDLLSQNASKEDLTRLVYAGYVPSGHGLPVGGSGFHIELHKNAQSEPPDPSKKVPTSGWSIGRHGNKENIGTGRKQ